ncbi:3'-5' exonuclease domain-containing protein [Psidium guajava]|nr:3'-5' exonuclease domain-containing protein [Psidium guajava]
MADSNLSTDLSIAEVKKSVLHDAAAHPRMGLLALAAVAPVEGSRRPLRGHAEHARGRGEEVCSVEESIKASFRGFGARL